MKPGFYEFFAGGGMARAGLGPGWDCLFANDFDPKKARAYRANWGDDVFRPGDIAALGAADLPGRADLIWGSFPCQDLSLAGAGAGLGGARSGAFFAFASLIGALGAEGRAPRMVAVENVTGALTSRGGADFAAICDALTAMDYRIGALVANADHFTPQSRARLFVIGAHRSLDLGAAALASVPSGWAHPPALVRAVGNLPGPLRRGHLWWAPPEPPRRNIGLSDIIEPAPEDAKWRTAEGTARLLELMNPAHRARVDAAVARSIGEKTRFVGCVYRRTRPDGAGGRVQRAEVRFDDVAGCLRTPGGGSSRQTLLVIEAGEVRARHLTAREAARLMGLEESYVLPPRELEAAHLLGDGVAAPVVRHLARHLIEPMIGCAGRADAA
ncbi:MAG: DNA cytosine methyltransferase [Paracoccaceae bacterium]